MTTLEILRAARALIDTPEKWIKGEDARDARGDEVEPESPEAVCFCAGGALRRVSGDPPGREIFDALAHEMDDVVFVHSFNDQPETTHADVLAAFDRAIAAEEARS